jgi:hypothetical protein
LGASREAKERKRKKGEAFRNAECGVGKKIKKDELGIKNWEGKAD